MLPLLTRSAWLTGSRLQAVTLCTAAAKVTLSPAQPIWPCCAQRCAIAAAVPSDCAEDARSPCCHGNQTYFCPADTSNLQKITVWHSPGQAALRLLSGSASRELCEGQTPLQEPQPPRRLLGCQAPLPARQRSPTCSAKARHPYRKRSSPTCSEDASRPCRSARSSARRRSCCCSRAVLTRPASSRAACCAAACAAAARGCLSSTCSTTPCRSCWCWCLQMPAPGTYTCCLGRCQLQPKSCPAHHKQVRTATPPPHRKCSFRYMQCSFRTRLLLSDKPWRGSTSHLLGL